MERKNLIIGCFSNYQYDKIAVWVNSAIENSSKNTEIVLIHTGVNIADDITNKLKEKEKIKLILVNDIPELAPHVKRFVFLYDYLKSLKENDYAFVTTTDVRDVYFQSCPSSWMKKNFNNFESLVCGSEGMLYKDEPWGNENLLQTFGHYFYNDFCNNEIYNVGVLGGSLATIRDLCLMIYQMSINRPIPIVDQAVFNVLIQSKPFKSVSYFAHQSKDNWACHAGTTADPSKIEIFRPLLTCKEPQVINGVFVPSENNEPFVIVHQYDRVPHWKKYIEGKYGHY